MTEPMYTWTPAEFAASRVLITHQRKADGLCCCGTADLMPDVGYYAGHIIDELGRAGLRITDERRP